MRVAVTHGRPEAVDANGGTDEPASSRDATQHVRGAGVLTRDQPFLEPSTSTDVRAASLSITADLVEDAFRHMAAEPPIPAALADPVHAAITSVNTANKILIVILSDFGAKPTA